MATDASFQSEGNARGLGTCIVEDDGTGINREGGADMLTYLGKHLVQVSLAGEDEAEGVEGLGLGQSLQPDSNTQSTRSAT